MIEPTDLHAYVDGELGAEASAELRKLIEKSPVDAREVEAIRNLKAMVSTKVEAPSVGQSWKSCVKRLDELDKSRRAENIVSRFAPVLCGTLFVCILVAGRVSAKKDHSKVSGPDLARMLGGTQSSTHSASWGENLIRQSFLSTPDHLVVLGGKVLSFNGVAVDAFKVRDANGNLTMLKFPPGLAFEGLMPMAGHDGLMMGSLDGVNCVAKDQGGQTVIIAAERSYEDLASVAAQVNVR